MAQRPNARQHKRWRQIPAISYAGQRNAQILTFWLIRRATRIRYTDSWRAEARGGVRKLAENRVTIDILHVLEQSGYDIGAVLRYPGARPPVYFNE